MEGRGKGCAAKGERMVRRREREKEKKWKKPSEKEREKQPLHFLVCGEVRTPPDTLVLGCKFRK